jgi:hypothetical protein
MNRQKETLQPNSLQQLAPDLWIANGSIIETNGKAMLKAGYEWLLDTQLD